MRTTLLILLLSSIVSTQAQEVNQEVFNLAEDVHLIKGGHKIHFKEVTSDSRCPKDVTCVMAGWAMITIDLIESGDRNPRSVAIKIPGLQGVESRIELFKNENGTMFVGALSPYPISTETFEQREYVLTVHWVAN